MTRAMPWHNGTLKLYNILFLHLLTGREKQQLCVWVRVKPGWVGQRGVTVTGDTDFKCLISRGALYVSETNHRVQQNHPGKR